MKISSLGYRTDLALLQLGGTEVEDCGDHLVVRTPSNPAYWWGNYLLLQNVPAVDEIDGWLELFRLTFPEAGHQAFGVDRVDGRVNDLQGFAERGLHCEAATVMTATEVHPPPRPNTEAAYRPLESDADWAQSVELSLLCSDAPDRQGEREFVERKSANNRAMTAAGHGGWFGAFSGRELMAQMGLLRAGDGLARFQWVETNPLFRGRGLAGTLVHHVSLFGLTELGASTLVMVADPDYLAVRVYRSVGFVDGETQLQVERRPGGAT